MALKIRQQVGCLMHSICTIKYKDATWNYFAVVNFSSVCHFFKIKMKTSKYKNWNCTIVFMDKNKRNCTIDEVYMRFKLTFAKFLVKQFSHLYNLIYSV
jgi:hypothetical protein